MDEHLEKRIGHSVLSNVLNAFISQKVLGHNGQQSALITETDQYSKANVSCCWQVRGSYHWVQLTCGSIRQWYLHWKNTKSRLSRRGWSLEVMTIFPIFLVFGPQCFF
jgi:hypothetical protein